MTTNDLLIWMSARGRGSWTQFRSAVERFHPEPFAIDDNGDNADGMAASDLPTYQEVRLGLQGLAHVEFFSTSAGADWRVVPPALAVRERNGDCIGVLCGARSPALLERLRILAGPVSLESQEIAGMPDRIVLTALHHDTLAQTAGALGLLFQVDAPASILAAIPSVDDPRSRFPAKPPGNPGWTIERFSASRLRWESAQLGRPIHTGTELFRYQMKYQRFYFLHSRGKAFKVPVQVGKFAVLRHRRVRNLLLYDRKREVLSVPVSCRPPLLIERALILCTGFLPLVERASARLGYTGIPLRIASLAAGLLRQELQIQ